MFDEVKSRGKSTGRTKIVIYRPHAEIWFKNPVRATLKGQFLPHKYEPFLDHLLQSDCELYFSTALWRSPGWKGLIRYLLEPIEIVLWCRLNGIPLKRARLLTRKSALAGKDALFLMHYGNFTHELLSRAEAGAGLARTLADTPVPKIVHMTHYAYQPVTGAFNLLALGPALLVAENDLRKNSAFFRQYFGDVRCEFESLPYIASKRFQKSSPFSDRLNKLVATGSITFKMRAPEFTNFFKADELQPLRRKLYESASRFTGEMDCLISDLNASRAAPSPPTGGWRARLARVVRRRHPQQDYYKTDIVAVYNAYTMFVVPEEICDLPAIGFVEGMACGCAYFGLDDPMYRDLGMVPGIHYVGYDGTVEGLMAKVRFYQEPEHVALLQEIAEQGRVFVEQRLRAQTVYSKFIDSLRARAD